MFLKLSYHPALYFEKKSTFENKKFCRGTDGSQGFEGNFFATKVFLLVITVFPEYS
jgi:hypothetical protein